jgi:hypothetical protein
MKRGGLPVAIALLGMVTACCRPQMTEFPARYSIDSPQAIEAVPVILVGLVLVGSHPAGPLHPSRVDPHVLTQLHQAKIRVENLVQGDVAQNDEINIFYSLDAVNLGSSASFLYFSRGDRRLFFLERDAGKLRTIYDTWNTCVLPVFSGFHPNFKRDPHQPATEAIVDLLLTRGEGATDKDMVKAVREVGNFDRFGDELQLKALQQIAREETPPVRHEACAELAIWGHPCPSSSDGQSAKEK